MKNIFKKIAAVCFISLFALIQCFGQNKKLRDGSLLYNDAVTAYEASDYGRALKFCEDAILSRKQQITYEIETLNIALEPRQVQKVGNKITDILKVLKERDDYDAIEIINFYLKKKGEDFFDDSILNLLSYLDSIQVYPEAQKLIGDIYKIEGEYDFAESYYHAALKNAAVLDIPDQRYEILYLLADISELKKDEDTREVRLLTILNEDKNYADKALVNSMIRTIRANKKDSFDKFFSLYRADGFYMLNAYSELAEYYSSKDEIEKALGFAALDVITGFTKIIDVIKKRNINFEYDGLKSVFYEASLYDDIIRWGRENNVWESFDFLAEIASKDGNDVFSNALLGVIADYIPDEYYRKKAVIILNQ